jgi:hypothetical protein
MQKIPMRHLNDLLPMHYHILQSIERLYFGISSDDCAIPLSGPNFTVSDNGGMF